MPDERIPDNYIMPDERIPDNYIMPFGKFRGREIGKVPAWYLNWLAKQSWLIQWPEVLQYVQENEDAIYDELNDSTN